MILTVFGGSAPKPGSPAYIAAHRLGMLAVEAGWSVATGGYMGVMEAVSRGASEAGGHVIGVTCKELELRRPAGANPWVKENRKFDTLRERLAHLIDCCDAAIAMPGGVGTLAEISIMWNGLVIESFPSKPLILVGDGWKQVMDGVFAQMGEYINHPDRTWLHYAQDEEQAVEILKQRF